jgi:transcriptional regulator with XRE-family HTH domain
MSYAADHIVSALRTAREKKGISQRELSAKAGVPQAQISRFENGDVDIRLSSLVSLGRALDLEIELVPRKAVSAVESIVRATTSSERAIQTTRTLNDVAKLVRTLKSVRSPEISSVAMEKVLSQLRMLERFPPTAEQLKAVKRFNDTLAKTKLPELDPEVFARHAKAIEHIRNQVAHAPLPASLPKPAYALDEEEDDDA